MVETMPQGGVPLRLVVDVQLLIIVLHQLIAL